MLFDYVPEMEQPIISHDPIERLWVGNRKGRAQKVHLETPFGRITVFNIHACSFGWRRRHRQMTALLQEDIVATQDPIVLEGDFNTPCQTQIDRMFSRYLKNAHWECGGSDHFPVIDGLVIS
jgi:endonuclease/exonuclease/phosphatase (EEP) superfamily protein YafD